MRADSYVLESNVHFPTDLNLLYDSGRKVLDCLMKLGFDLAGHRQLKSCLKKWKQAYRQSSEIHRKKGKNYQNRMRSAASNYLSRSRSLSAKAHSTIGQLIFDSQNGELSQSSLSICNKLLVFLDYLEKHIDLVERRIIKGEKIAHQDKLFSIFEDHVEWISKGKAGKAVELGHRHLIYSDQYQFIPHQKVLIKQTDKEVGLSEGIAVVELYGTIHYQYASLSYDRGFYSLPAKQKLSKIYGKVILPKVGKKTPAQQAEENSADYIALRHHHSGVEANINSLEHTGLDKCPDKGLQRFKNYAAMGVVTHNIGNLGKWLIALEKPKETQRNKAA